MILDLDRRFCFLANTKTASSAIEAWIPQSSAQIRFGEVPFKHANFRQFKRFCSLFEIEVERFEIFAIIRHPLDKVASWYKFRCRDELKNPAHRNHNRSLAHLTFETYLSGEIEKGEQSGSREELEFLDRDFVSDENGQVGVKRVFKYEDIDDAFRFLAGRFQLADKPGRINVSPEVDISLSEQTLKRFRSVFRDDIQWYETFRG